MLLSYHSELMSENPDIILVAEFKQILGPAIIYKIPNIPKVA